MNRIACNTDNSNEAALLLPDHGGRDDGRELGKKTERVRARSGVIWRGKDGGGGEGKHHGCRGVGSVP